MRKQVFKAASNYVLLFSKKHDIDMLTSISLYIMCCDIMLIKIHEAFEHIFDDNCM